MFQVIHRYQLRLALNIAAVHFNLRHFLYAIQTQGVEQDVPLVVRVAPLQSGILMFNEKMGATQFC